MLDAIFTMCHVDKHTFAIQPAQPKFISSTNTTVLNYGTHRLAQIELHLAQQQSHSQKVIIATLPYLLLKTRSVSIMGCNLDYMTSLIANQWENVLTLICINIALSIYLWRPALIHTCNTLFHTQPIHTTPQLSDKVIAQRTLAFTSILHFLIFAVALYFNGWIFSARSALKH